MKFYDLQKKIIKNPVFSFDDIFKLFPGENTAKLRVQLSHWTSQGKLTRLRRGLYCLSEAEFKDPFVLSELIYSPSYISLESALNFYGMIPDIPNSITAVSTNSPRVFNNRFGNFTYRKLKGDYFFGFNKIEVDAYFYLIACPEKALLDYVYYKFRGIYSKEVSEMRLTFPSDFSFKKLKQQSSVFKSSRIKLMVREVINDNE